MRERALELRVAAELADDLAAQERGQRLVDALSGDVLQHADRERAADRRGDLGEPARTVRLAVDPRDEQVLERRRQQLERPHRHRPRPAAWLEGALEERPRELLEVERVALRLPDEARSGSRDRSVADQPAQQLLGAASESGPSGSSVVRCP